MTEIQTIPIHPDCRYVLLLEHNNKMDEEVLEELHVALADWWKSGSKFFVMAVALCDVRFERIEGVDNDG